MADSMTLRIANFESQLRMLESRNCHVIPLSDWVAWRLALASGDAAPLPARAVVLTADDGHRSQFEAMAPALRERSWPVTLFVYPSAISNASYAMTWPQLRELAADPLVSVQSHTLWHPNLVRERGRMAPQAFRRFVADQLTRSRDTLEQKLAHPVTLLAWPFGLSDEGLAAQAAEAGYRSAFSLGNRSAGPADPLYAVPRHLIVDSVDASQLAARLEAAFANGMAS
ncbi:polysaccharide deacetylase family protein [Ideonella azotifigens]|uniref:NodB homology domain-containing protein n=2 Tax=Ideonella azotifigens TaxID=513160 RepID=A0ABP3VQX0_9BURK|nr:polysaccharide deacetylase family protein [Ideonella azotifigens]